MIYIIIIDMYTQAHLPVNIIDSAWWKLSPDRTLTFLGSVMLLSRLFLFSILIVCNQIPVQYDQWSKSLLHNIHFDVPNINKAEEKLLWKYFYTYVVHHYTSCGILYKQPLHSLFSEKVCQWVRYKMDQMKSFP